MHLTSLILYDKYYRLGYYDGITYDKFLEYVKNGNGNGDKDKSWIWIDDKELKWTKSKIGGHPKPIDDYEKFKKLCKGFVWAIVLYERQSIS